MIVWYILLIVLAGYMIYTSYTMIKEHWVKPNDALDYIGNSSLIFLAMLLLSIPVGCYLIFH